MPLFLTTSSNRLRAAARLALLCATAVAASVAHADTERFGLRVIADGDSSAKVLEVAGRPDATAHVKASRKHGDGGERWSYQRDGKRIDITLHGGVVTAIVTHRAK